MERNNSNSLIIISPIATASSINQSTTIDMDIQPKGKRAIQSTAKVHTVDEICEYAKIVFENNSKATFADGGVARSENLIRWLSIQPANDPEVSLAQRQIQLFAKDFDETRETISDYRRPLQTVLNQIAGIKLVSEGQTKPSTNKRNRPKGIYRPVGEEQAAPLISQEAKDKICEQVRAVFEQSVFTEDANVDRADELVKWIFEQIMDTEEIRRLKTRLLEFGGRYEAEPTETHKHGPTLRKIFTAIEALKQLKEAQANVILEDKWAATASEMNWERLQAFQAATVKMKSRREEDAVASASENALNVAEPVVGLGISAETGSHVYGMSTVIPDYQTYLKALSKSTVASVACGEPDVDAEIAIAAYRAYHPEKDAVLPDDAAYTRAITQRTIIAVANGERELDAETTIAAYEANILRVLDDAMAALDQEGMFDVQD